jgi:hypothetical protein
MAKFSINKELIKSALSQISELREILVKEEYSQDAVINKIRKLNTQLSQISELPKNFVNTHKGKLISWKKKLENQSMPLNELVSDFQKIPKKMDIKDEKSIEELDITLDLLSEKYKDDDKILNIVQEAFTVNFNDLRLLLGENLFINFAKQRKRIYFFTNYIFRFRLFILKFLAALISFLITSIFSLALELTLPDISNIYLNIGVFIIGFFIIDKYIDKKENKTFWNIARKQTLILSKQLSTYTNQILIILKFINAKK